MTEASAPSYRLKLPCSDEREFREKFLQKYVARGIFVPSERPKPVGTRLKLKLEIRGGTVLVSGDGMVTSVAQAGTAKPGMTVRLTMLHPESIQFSLSPSGDASPRAAAPVAPRPPPAATAAATPPVPRAPPLPPQPSARPAVPAVPAAAPPPVPAPKAAPPASPRASEDEGLFDLDDPLPATPDDGVMASTDPAIPVPFELLEPEAIHSEATPEPAPTPPPVAAPPPRAKRAAPSKRLVLLVAAGAVAAAILAIGAVSASRSARAAREHSARVDEQLRIADLRLLEGRLASAGGDSALDHLLEAKGLAPNDGRVATRLKLLADKFEQLGARAVARKNLREASVHFKAALMADPARADARAKLDELEAKLAGSTRSR